MAGVTLTFYLVTLTFLAVVTAQRLPLQIDSTPIQLSDPKLTPLKNRAQPQVFLPTAVTPVHYNLRIRPTLNDPDLDESEWFTAPGTVTILFDCNGATSNVTVHKDPSLQVNEMSFLLFEINADGSHGSKIDVVGTQYDAPNVFYTIHLASSLTGGRRYEISMEFIAQIRETNEGIYRGQYETPEGEIRHMATTQFQAYGARMAFPCFDEPGLKATFDITVGRKSNLNSLCNTLPKEVGVTDPLLPMGYVWDVYNTTQPMSTYLVAIIVSDFVCESADATIFDGRPVRVCGPPHQIEGQKGGVFSSEAAARTMKYFEETFKYPYEMYKVDNAAIPRQYFAPGAMENWGMVTYRDNLVLFYDGESSEQERYGVWSIFFHELAHQWWGDLLTCATWGHAWLNEGFATYSSFMINGVAPEFDTQNIFLWEKVQAAFLYDVGRDEPVYNEDFDSGGDIIYAKGASLLRMVEGVFGKQVLIEALQVYANRYAYQPVKQDQFFGVLQEFAQGKIPEGVTMKQILDTWTVKAGYPLLRVTKVNDSQIYISQEKFLPTTEIRPNDKWEVPIAIASLQNPDFSNHTPALWLNTVSSGQYFDIDAGNWIVLNPDAMTFARVLYDDELLAQIHNQLNQNLDNLSGLSRAQIIDDYFNFAKLGHEPIDKALSFTQNLEKENNHIVWFTVFRHSSKTRDLFENVPEFDAYLMPKLEAVLDRLLLNWTVPLNKVGSGSKVIFASRLLDWACSLQSPKCRSLAKSLFSQWMDSPETLGELMPPDFETVMLCHGVNQLGQQGHDFLSQQYDNANPFGLHKARFLSALSCATSDVLEGFLFNKVLNGASNFMGKEDVATLVKKMAENPSGRPVIVEVLLEQAHKLRAWIGEEGMAELVMTLSNFYATEIELTQFEKFLDQLLPKMSTQETILKKSLENIRENIDWMLTLGQSIKSWLSNNAL